MVLLIFKVGCNNLSLHVYIFHVVMTCYTSTCQHKTTRPCKHNRNFRGVHRRFRTYVYRYLLVHKKIICCSHTYPLLTPLRKNVWALLENNIFFIPFSSGNRDFPKIAFSHYAVMKEKNMHFFPTCLPNQKIQGSGAANKPVFNDGLTNVHLQRWIDKNELRKEKHINEQTLKSLSN